MLATHRLQIPRLQRSCTRSRDDKAASCSTNHCSRQGHCPVCAGSSYPRPSEERKWNVMSFVGDMGARTVAYKRGICRDKRIISLTVCKNGQTGNGLQGNVTFIVTVVFDWNHRLLAISTALRVIWYPPIGDAFLNLYSPVVTICTTSLTFNNSTFCPHSCICVFCVDLRTNSYYFPIQH